MVVLVGRANAGKSTLFNRIVGRNRAITSAIAGTTRDLNIARAAHEGREFTVVDSGGLELGGRAPATAASSTMSARIVEEALRGVASADVVVFVLDGRAGLSAADEEAVAVIRETGRPILIAVNKLDRPAQEAGASEFYALGADHLFPISVGAWARNRRVARRSDRAFAAVAAGCRIAARVARRTDRTAERGQVLDSQSARRLHPRDGGRLARNDPRHG